MPDKIYIWETDDCKRSWGEIPPTVTSHTFKYRKGPTPYVSYEDHLRISRQKHKEGFNSGCESAIRAHYFGKNPRKKGKYAHAVVYTSLALVVILVLLTILLLL